MVAYIRSDLEFILAQIKIAEAHALYEQSGGSLGNPLFGVGSSGQAASIPTYNLSLGLAHRRWQLQPPAARPGAMGRGRPRIPRAGAGGVPHRHGHVGPDGPGPAPVILHAGELTTMDPDPLVLATCSTPACARSATSWSIRPLATLPRS